MAKIYKDFQPANLMSFAKSFARLNGQPLDKTDIWYNLEEAKAYAKTDAAYVGQVLAIIDESKKSVVFYGIQNAEGDLKEVGSTPLGDNLSVEIVEGKIQLKNFGKEYYAYTPAAKSELGTIAEPAKYTLTQGFKEGLEPRVVSNDSGGFAIAWFEPSLETVEDLGDRIDSLTQQVEAVKQDIGVPSSPEGATATGIHKDIEDLNTKVEEKANANDVYTKIQTDEAIKKAVNDSDHLRRKIVANIGEIDVNAADADLYIYMVPTGQQQDDDKYDEYIVINKTVEKVGSWEVDLTNYATKKELTTVDAKVDTLSGKVSQDKTELDGKISQVKQELADEIKRATAAEGANAEAIKNKADKATTLQGYGITDAYTKKETDALIDGVNTNLNTYKGEVNSHLQQIDGKLEALQGAEKNYISSVDPINFNVSDEGKLTLVSVKVNQVEGLQDILDTKTITEEEKGALQKVIAGEFNNYIKSVTDDFNVTPEGQLKLVKVSAGALSDIVGNLTDLIDYQEGTTIVNEINELKQLLVWQEMANS